MAQLARRPAGKPVRFGLIGAGAWGRNYIRTLAGIPDARLTRLSCQAPESAYLMPEAQFTLDWRELIAARDLRAVIVATPPALHFDMAVAAIEAGLGLIVEKPLTAHPDEAETLRALAKRRRAVIVVDHVLLFHPGFAALMERLPELGPVRRVRCACIGAGPASFRRDIPPFEDFAPHAFAQALTVIGAPVVASQARHLHDRKVEEGREELVAVELRFADGAVGEVIAGNRREGRERWLQVDGERGRAVFSDLVPEPLRIDLGAGWTAPPVPSEPPLTRAVLTLLAGLRGEAAPHLGIDLAADVVALMARSRQQLRERAAAQVYAASA